MPVDPLPSQFQYLQDLPNADELFVNCIKMESALRFAPSTIGSYGLSGCKFLLLTGDYESKPFSHLDHTEMFFNGHPLQILKLIFGGIKDDFYSHFKHFFQRTLFQIWRIYIC
ncbi:hypothetical protein I4U23_010558 [Adineta vaga]|nr:hypothetical protein I4U23_010558 [Adineta vaga]